jgi:hypothetical protein
MLRDDFEQLLKEFGSNALIVRQSTNLRCSCWSEKEQEASRDCPVCFGIGSVPVIEKHTVRSEVATIPQTLPRAIGDLAIGDMSSSAKAFYCKVDVKLSLGDLILEVDWSPTGKPIYGDGELFEINYIDVKRFEQGLPTYQKAYCEGRPIESKIRGIRIANSNGIKNYEIIREGGTT